MNCLLLSVEEVDVFKNLILQIISAEVLYIYSHFCFVMTCGLFLVFFAAATVQALLYGGSCRQFFPAELLYY